MTKNPQAVLDVLEFYSENFGAIVPEPREIMRAETDNYSQSSRSKENNGSRLNSLRPSQSNNTMNMKVNIVLTP
jgi:hypothetical protein